MDLILGTPRSLHSPSKQQRPQSSPSDSSAAPPVPDEVPSIVEIKRILPKHCFQPSLQTSLYFVGKDFFYIAVLYALNSFVEKMPFTMLYYVWTPTYCFLQGTMFWALFVLGHDCGHGSFSHSPLLNDILGTFLHAIIAVPYYPWKLSHKHHHKHTGNIDKDEIFYPVRQRDVKTEKDAKHLLGFGLGFGWFVYLIYGFSPRTLSHFNPKENMFAGHMLGCVSSLVALVAWSYALYLYWLYMGTTALLVHYAAPVFVFASWLVLVTFLHHMAVGVPWYSTDRWSNVRGQLSTVDRDYGWAHELTHNIGTHQIHHLFTKIPHYYLEDATKNFREVYPHLVRKCDKSNIPAFFYNFDVYEAERHVRDDTDVHVWKGGQKQA